MIRTILAVTLILIVFLSAAFITGCSGGGFTNGATGSSSNGGENTKAKWIRKYPLTSGGMSVKGGNRYFKKSASKGSHKVVVGTNGEIFTAHGNSNYEAKTSGTSEDLLDVKAKSDGTFKTVGGNLTTVIRESDVGGDNWTTPTINNPEKAGRLNGIAIDPDDEDKQYAGGESGYAEFDKNTGKWNCYNTIGKTITCIANGASRNISTSASHFWQNIALNFYSNINI